MQDTSYKLWVMLSRVDTELLLAVGRAISRPNNSEKPTQHDPIRLKPHKKRRER